MNEVDPSQEQPDCSLEFRETVKFELKNNNIQYLSNRYLDVPPWFPLLYTHKHENLFLKRSLLKFHLNRNYNDKISYKKNHL